MKTKSIVHKKRIRLKDFDYKGACRYFITLCTHDRHPIFEDDALVEWLVGVLRERAEFFDFKIWAWCFMPDHLHLLIEGNGRNSDMRRFVSSFKQHTGFYRRRAAGSPLWQANFHEHVLRGEEDTIAVARYIFGNPVRKGLVDDYTRYRFLGSFEFDILTDM